MTDGRQRSLALRRIDATASAKSRLVREHCATLSLQDGIDMTLHAHVCAQPTPKAETGLPVLTRFGHALLFDYEPLLLACTAVDVSRAEMPSAREALTRYGVAALPATLLAALGDPMVCTAASSAIAADCVTIGLRCALPTIRLTMRLATRPHALHAMFDSAPWQPVCTPAASWLTALRTGHRLMAGELTLPFSGYRQLRCGHLIRLPLSPFDVNGRATLRIAGRAIEVQWLTHQHCFEVQRMSSGDILSRIHPEVSEPSPELEPARADPTQLPVRLSFLVGTLALPFGEVAALRSGSLLKLETGLPPTVRIEANGVPVGYGELVDFDGHLAVEITQWPQAPDDRQTR